MGRCALDPDEAFENGRGRVARGRSFLRRSHSANLAVRHRLSLITAQLCQQRPSVRSTASIRAADSRNPTYLHASEQGLSVFVSRSKTDQAGHGTTIGIAAPTSGPPAVEEDGTVGLLDAGVAWVRSRDLLGAHGIVDGPAWRGIDRYGRRLRAAGLHRNSIAAIIARRAPPPDSKTLSGGVGTACAAGSPPKPSPPGSPSATSSATAAQLVPHVWSPPAVTRTSGARRPRCETAQHTA